ncbi:hypothetical protein KP509_28G027300 [Ceratopteris richardii]|uniref:Pentatricopeptide repeat-containing protein n=1 Tax=Ceratopteris richardii TaxID=49495 RepID=A0A8T2RD78_CERRI|nr:hypothetical protein KP509_28G027300 [Ceratopteris richardii]
MDIFSISFLRNKQYDFQANNLQIHRILDFRSNYFICSRLKELARGHEIHNHIHWGVENDVFVGSTLVDMYAKCGSFSEAFLVFHSLKNRNNVSWNALIAGYVQLGLSNDVLECLENMEEEGVVPDIITFTCSLKACPSARMIDKGQNMRARVTELGYNDLILMSNMVDFYAKNGFMLEALKVFRKLIVRDTVAWMALIAGYPERGPHEEVFRCLWQMQEERLSPDAAILVCVLKACDNVGSFSQGQLVHIDLVNKGLETDIFVENMLVDVYSKCRLVSDSRAVFDEQSKKDVVSWNALLLGYAEYGPLDEAISCFEQLAAFLSPNSSTLCDMYAKCGSLMEAQKVLDMLEDCSIVSWTVLVSGYAEQGLISKALHCFEQI